MELKIINNQEVMNKDFKLGLVMQSIGSGSVLGGSGIKHQSNGHSCPLCIEGRAVYGVFEVCNDSGKHIIYITDKYDMDRINELNLDWQNLAGANPDDIYHFGTILLKYDDVGVDFVRLAADLDSVDACLAIGISLYGREDAEQEALDFGKRHIQKAADNGDACGKCWLGRYYAEGKGCKKNKRMAKKWLEEATQECPDAEKYLDQYGL